jgi:hypothetical protein
MKTTRLIAMLVGLAAIAIVTADASAMYHPGMGVFLQRDPGAGGAMRIGAGGATPVGQFIPRDADTVRSTEDPLGAHLRAMGLVAGPVPKSEAVSQILRVAAVGAFAESPMDVRRSVGEVADGGSFLPRDVEMMKAMPVLSQYADGMNLYGYVRGNPLRWQDPSGLQIMICTTPKRWYLLGGRHAYLWDTTQNQSCGESGSSGSGGDYKNGYPDGGQPGPGGKGHTCTAVPNSNGKEKCVMDWCKEHMNEGPWVPFVYDCHSRVEKALKECCLSDKGVPHPRF